MSERTDLLVSGWGSNVCPALISLLWVYPHPPLLSCPSFSRLFSFRLFYRPSEPSSFIRVTPVQMSWHFVYKVRHIGTLFCSFIIRYRRISAHNVLWSAILVPFFIVSISHKISGLFFIWWYNIWKKNRPIGACLYEPPYFYSFLNVWTMCIYFLHDIAYEKKNSPIGSFVYMSRQSPPYFYSFLDVWTGMSWPRQPPLCNSSPTFPDAPPSWSLIHQLTLPVPAHHSWSPFVFAYKHFTQPSRIYLLSSIWLDISWNSSSWLASFISLFHATTSIYSIQLFLSLSLLLQ